MTILNRFDWSEKTLVYSTIAFLVLILSIQWYFWNHIPEYSFGFLAPIFAAWVFYERLPKIKSMIEAGKEASKGHQILDFASMLAILGGLLALGMAALRITADGPTVLGSMVGSLGFASYTLGVALYLSRHTVKDEKKVLKQRLSFAALFLFPALIWMVSSPMAMGLESAVKLFLLNKVVVVVFFVFDFLGLPLQQEGNILILPTGHVGVEDACSGIRSLTACLFAGSFLAAVFLPTLLRKVILIGIALILAVITNLLRGLFLTGWAYHYGPEAIAGTVHDVAGYAVLGLTVIGLLCIMPIMQLQADPTASKKQN